MLRNHYIRIYQHDRYATIFLREQQELWGTVASGVWSHTNYSHDRRQIKFTSDNPEYFHWEWNGPHAGELVIGVKMTDASHKTGEGAYFQPIIKLKQVRRQTDSYFKVGSAVLPTSFGELKYNVHSYFKAGIILWNVVEKEALSSN